MADFVTVSTLITHSDPKALAASLAIAYTAGVAALESPITPTDYLEGLMSYSELWMIPDEISRDVVMLIEKTCRSVRDGEGTPSFALSLDLKRGVGGYIYETLPIVIHAWLSNQLDFRATITQVILCGGDTDTTAAIAGALAGSQTGPAGIPEEWLAGLCDWPRSKAWIERLAKVVDESNRQTSRVSTPHLFIPALLIRNILFAVIVLAHGFRRALPPY